MRTDPLAWLDGEFVRSESLPKPSGRGFFETMRVCDGRVPLWSRHLRRLRGSVEAHGMPWGVASDLESIGAELAQRGDRRDDVLRLAVFEDGDRVRVQFTTRERPLNVQPVVLALVTADEGGVGATPDHKSVHREGYDAAFEEAREQGADDVLLVTPDGTVLETAIGNVFALVDEQIVTPRLDGRLLPGIGREVLLERFGERMIETTLDIGMLERASCVWATNAVLGPRVARVSKDPTPDSGPWATELIGAWHAALRS